MESMLVFIVVFILVVVAMAILDMFVKLKREALDRQYDTNIPEPRKCCCPICGAVMDITKTQRIIVTKKGAETCCLWHTNKEMVDYFKRVQSEALKNAKEKDIHG